MSDNQKVAKEIISELSKTANLISNASQGSREKTLSVKMVDDGNPADIVIDANKFLNKEGNLEYNEKAISEAKGKILATQEMGRTTTHDESMALRGYSTFPATKEIKALFEGIQTKNGFDAVKEKWVGFKDEVEAFQESIAVSRSITKETPINKKINAIVEKWTLPQSEVDFGDTGIGEHFQEFSDILDYVSEDFKKNPNPKGFERLEVTKNIYDTIKKKIVEVEQQKPENPDGDDGDDDKPKGKDKGKGKGNGKPDNEDDVSQRIKGNPASIKDAGLLEELKEAQEEKPSEDGATFQMAEGTADPAKVKYLLHKNKPDNDDKELFKQFLVKNRRAIETIRQSFAFKQVQLSRPDYGKQMGDVDIGGLHKFHMGEKIRLFETKETPKGKAYTIGILLDQSGSMSGNKIREARTVANIITQAVRGIKGISLCVYGHTADHRGTNTINIFPYFDKGFDWSNKLANAASMSNNGDGYAIRWMTNKMLETNPANKNSLHQLFVVSDGQPACSSYIGSSGIEHTKRCVEDARKSGVQVYGIGIANAYPASTGERLYGNGNFVVLKDTLSSLPLLARSIKKLIGSDK